MEFKADGNTREVNGRQEYEIPMKKINYTHEVRENRD